MRLRLDDRRLSAAALSGEEPLGVLFDWGLYSIGYETRSRFLIEKLRSSCKNVLAIDLGGDHIASYDENQGFANHHRFKVLPKHLIALRPEGHMPVLRAEDGAVTRILIDVSSMDRRTMSLVIYWVLRQLADVEAELYFLYAPAQFVAPPRHELPVESSEPINALLAGYPRDPQFPTILFLGLGYEFGLALGVVEMFEPAKVLAFTARGTDSRIDQMVDRVNEPLFGNTNQVERVEYRLSAPASTLLDITQRVLALRDHAKIIFVPLGPKIFSAMGILMGYIHSPDIAVWRISTQLDPRNCERVSDGTIIGFKILIRAVATAPSS